MRKEVYVDISARHVHLRPQDVETLFGPGAELTLRGQDNFMGGSVYTQRVEIQGPKGSIPKVTILGPCGSIEIQQGVIAAHRHIHMTPQDAADAGVQAGDIVAIRISGTGRETIYKDVSVSQTNSSHTAVHIDTDEANAAGMPGAMMGELIVD